MEPHTSVLQLSVRQQGWAEGWERGRNVYPHSQLPAGLILPRAPEFLPGSGHLARDFGALGDVGTNGLWSLLTSVLPLPRGMLSMAFPSAVILPPGTRRYSWTSQAGSSQAERDGKSPRARRGSAEAIGNGLAFPPSLLFS